MALTTRRRALTTLGAALAGAVALPAGAASASEGRHWPRPLWRAHAHNDYEHPRPLLDALDHRFGSVEADIYLVDGQLLVTPRTSTRPAPWSRSTSTRSPPASARTTAACTAGTAAPSSS